MARRSRAAADPDEDSGSLKENVGPGRTPNGKKEHSRGKGKTRRVDSDNEGDDNQLENSQPTLEEDAQGGPDEDVEEEDEAGSPKGRKRARINTEGDSAPASPNRSALVERIQTLPRDDDG